MPRKAFGIYRDQGVLQPRESDDVHVYGFLMPQRPLAPCSPAAVVCNRSSQGAQSGAWAVTPFQRAAWNVRE